MELGTVIDAGASEDLDLSNQPDPEANTDPDPAADPAADLSATPDPVAEDWRKVPAHLRDYFKTPEGKAAKDAWYERNAFKEVFNGGVSQAKEIHAFLEEHGGKDGVVQALGDLTGKAQELDGITAKMQSGDPSLISDLMQASPEGFAKLAPIVAEQWASADPEGWGAAMSGIMAATIQQNGIPAFLDKMDMMLKYNDTESFGAALKQLRGWADSFGQKAAAPRQAPQVHPNKLDQREQQINQREADLRTTEFRRETDGFRDPTIAAELKSYFDRKPGDADSKDIAVNEVKRQVTALLSADKDYQSKLNSFMNRGDKDGFMRLFKSREAAAIKQIAPKVGRAVFGNPGPAVVKKEETVAAPRVAVSRPGQPADPRKAIMDRIFAR